MANVSWGKKLLAIAVACCACAMIAVPAYAFYYVHSDEGVQVESKGVYEVTCVLDETAQGGAIRSELVIVPRGKHCQGPAERGCHVQREPERP